MKSKSQKTSKYLLFNAGSSLSLSLYSKRLVRDEISCFALFRMNGTENKYSAFGHASLRGSSSC